MASPEDLSRLVMAAAQNPTIRDFSTDTEHSVRIGRHMVAFRTTDALVRNPAWNIIVQKTGYITEAGRCLVMQAVIGGRNVVIVLLNSFGKYTRVADAVRMRTLDRGAHERTHRARRRQQQYLSYESGAM